MPDLLFESFDIFIPNLSVPDISDFTFTNIFDFISNIFTFIITLFSDLYDAIYNMFLFLIEINSYINDLCMSASSGNIHNVPILECVGLYRYIVTDVIFYLTYMLVLSGCLFTIYKLANLLIMSFKEIISVSKGGGVTKGGILNQLGKLFK